MYINFVLVSEDKLLSKAGRTSNPMPENAAIFSLKIPELVITDQSFSG